MANYEEIKKQQLSEAERQQAQYEASRNKNAQDYYGQIEKAIDTALEPTKQGIQQQIDATPRQYRSLFDANAVQQRVNERILQERMANMGLTDSGLNRSQMTALSAQRGNADNAVRMQQQDAIDKLNQQLAEIMAQASANKQQQSANIFAQAANDILGNRSSLWQNAASNAASVYNSELEREAAAAQLAAQQAYQAAQLEAEREKAKQEETLRQREEALSIAKLLNDAAANGSADTVNEYLGASGMLGDQAKIWYSYVPKSVRDTAQSYMNSGNTYRALEYLTKSLGTGDALEAAISWLGIPISTQNQFIEDMTSGTASPTSPGSQRLTRADFDAAQKRME